MQRKSMARMEAMIYSMTPEERRNPDLMNPSRKHRIAKGAGVDISEVNRMVKQFERDEKDDEDKWETWVVKRENSDYLFNI